MATVMLRVSTRARDEARELAARTGQSMTSAVERAIHDAAVRAYYAKVAEAVDRCLDDPDERAAYERETEPWAMASAVPDEVWTDNDFLGLDDDSPAPARAA